LQGRIFYLITNIINFKQEITKDSPKRDKNKPKVPKNQCWWEKSEFKQCRKEK
jgi:hypothetical protein